MAEREYGQLSVHEYATVIEQRIATSPEPAVTLCTVAAETLGASGVGIGLLQGGALEWVAVSDERSGQVEAIEYTLGEGPCVTASRSGTPALAGDLAGSAAAVWPAFCREALRAGISAAFGFPLLVGSSCIGAMNVYCVEPGDLHPGQLADAAAVATVSGRTLLDWQSTAAPGTLAWQLEDPARHRVAVHQAIGRISARAAVSLADAQALLRAYAFAHDRPLLDVAAEIAAGTLRLD